MKETVEEGHGIFKDHNVLAQTHHPESCKLAPGRDTGPKPIASRGQGQRQDPGPGSPHTLQPEFPELDGISETHDPGGSQWEKTRKALTGISFLLWHHQWKTGSSRRWCSQRSCPVACNKHNRPCTGSGASDAVARGRGAFLMG